MNLVGKILTVLICVMSIVFAWTAVMVYSTHRNYYDVVMRSPTDAAKRGEKPGLKFQLQEEKDRRAELETQLKRLEEKLQQEQEAHDRQIGQLETAVDELRRERDARDAQIRERDQQIDGALAAIRVEQTNLNGVEAEVDRLRQEVDKTRKARDAAFRDAVVATDQLHQLTTEQKRLEARLADLTVDATRMRDLLRLSDINPDADPASIIPDVNGNVLSAAGDGYLEVSIGADDGLRKGHRLEVSRKTAGVNRYLGRVEVVETFPDRAVCKVLPKYRTGEIRKGDSVESRLN